MWCKSLEVLNPYEALKEANMPDLKPCPFVISGQCDAPPCNSCFLPCESRTKGKCEKCGNVKTIAVMVDGHPWCEERFVAALCGEEDKHEP